MATIRRRGNHYQVQIRRKGVSVRTLTFPSLREAREWASREEARLDGVPVGKEVAGHLRDVLQRYLSEITPAKKGAFQEGKRIRRLLTDPIVDLPIRRLSGGVLAAFRDRRVADGVRACQYDLVLIRHALEIARKEWGYYLPSNPADFVKIPNGVRRRDRRLTEDEMGRLMAALEESRNPAFRALVRFAIESGMRQSELLRAKWDDFDQKAGLLVIPETKNGEVRRIPVTKLGALALTGLVKTSAFLFPIKPLAVRSAWVRLTSRAKISDFRFHDLRHEAISRFFELGLTIPEVALISGHKDVRTLFRYTHLRAEAVGTKIETLRESKSP